MCNDAAEGAARYEHPSINSHRLISVRPSDEHPGAARPLIGRRSSCFGDALSVANVQQLLAGYVSRTRVHPIIGARRGEHPSERDGGQADQQLMREPTKSAIFRYRLPRRREPVSAAPASWSGLADM